MESSSKEPIRFFLLFCGFRGLPEKTGSADCEVRVEYLCTPQFLHIAALFILSKAIINLHDKLKKVPGKKLTKFVLALVCD